MVSSVCAVHSFSSRRCLRSQKFVEVLAMKGVKCVLVLLLVLFFSCESSAVDKKRFPTSPVSNHGKKWRVAYFERRSLF